MNKILTGFVVGLALGGGATWLALRHPAESPVSKAEAGATKAPEPANPLRLTAAKREQAGITLAKPTARVVAPEVQAYGRVLDPGSLATLVAERDTAQAALNASAKDLERARKLFAAGGNASAQAVETAEANAARDRAALASAQARLVATWGRAIADTAGDLSATLLKGGSLVRIDVLAGDVPAADTKEARVVVSGRDEAFSAEILGAAPVADAQSQGTGFLALVSKASLPAGAALRATLPGAGATANALVVPRSAIVYHQGSAWIFVLGEEDTFERKLVTLGRTISGDSVAILSGLEADDQVAITGAEQLLAAELQAGGSAEP